MGEYINSLIISQQGDEPTMTIRTICERCGKVIAYTDPNQQIFEVMTNPDQFCRCDTEIEHVKA